MPTGKMINQNRDATTSALRSHGGVKRQATTAMQTRMMPTMPIAMPIAVVVSALPMDEESTGSGDGGVSAKLRIMVDIVMTIPAMGANKQSDPVTPNSRPGSELRLRARDSERSVAMSHIDSVKARSQGCRL